MTADGDARPDLVITSVNGGVALVELNRPDAGNAVTPPMTTALIAAFEAANEDESVRAVVLTGRGRHFCVGMDLNARAGLQVTNRPTIGGVPRDRGGRFALQALAMRKPLVAAVNGAAIGFGATSTLAFDIRIAARSARFGFPFVRRGITPEAISTWLLPRVVGMSTATRWMVTGATVGADEAERAGLVTLVDDKELLPYALGIARDLAENVSPAAAAATRYLLWSGLSAGSPWEAHRLESESLSRLSGAEDAREGFAAFLEKRGPRFASDALKDFPDGYSWPEPPPDLGGVTEEFGPGGERY